MATLAFGIAFVFLNGYSKGGFKISGVSRKSFLQHNFF